MAKLTAAARKKIPTKDFAVSGRRYPIQNISHARNALARASGKSVEPTVRAKVHRKYPSIKMQKGGVVAGVHYGAPVSSPKKPHSYEHGGVVDRVGQEMLTGKREMLPKMQHGGVAKKSGSGDQSPASCGGMKGHGSFKDL